MQSILKLTVLTSVLTKRSPALRSSKSDWISKCSLPLHFYDHTYHRQRHLLLHCHHQCCQFQKKPHGGVVPQNYYHQAALSRFVIRVNNCSLLCNTQYSRREAPNFANLTMKIILVCNLHFPLQILAADQMEFINPKCNKVVHIINTTTTTPIHL